MDMATLIKEGKQYNSIETDYILDRLSDDSRMTVYDTEEKRDVRVFIARVDSSIERLGTVFVRKLDAEGKPAGVERMVEPGYYLSGCEYAELTI